MDRFNVSLFGDYFETLLWVRGDGRELAGRLATLVDGAIAQAHEIAGVQMVEVKAGESIREDLSVTQFYSGDAYYRGVLDLGCLFEDDALALVDHKTGQRVPGSSIVDQLEGYAVLAAAAFRHVRTFWLGVHWIAERAVEWGTPVSPETVIDRLVPDLLDNIEAGALAVSDGPRPNPGPWGDRCSYRERCPASRELRYDPVEYYDDED